MAPVSRPIVSILSACLNARSRASCAATSSAVIRSPLYAAAWAASSGPDPCHARRKSFRQHTARTRPLPVLRRVTSSPHTLSEAPHMRDSAPHRLTERRQAILRQTSAALRGRVVTLWRVARGLAVAEVASRPNPPRDAIEFDVAAALGTWVGAVGDKSLWVACRFDPSRLHVARVRSDVPAPPPAGIERRSPERLVLELAGLSLGALERIWAVADQATGYLCGALALLDACFERVRRVESLTPSARSSRTQSRARSTPHERNRRRSLTEAGTGPARTRHPLSRASPFLVKRLLSRRRDVIDNPLHHPGGPTRRTGRHGNDPCAARRGGGHGRPRLRARPNQSPTRSLRGARLSLARRARARRGDSRRALLRRRDPGVRFLTR